MKLKKKNEFKKKNGNIKKAWTYEKKSEFKKKNGNIKKA